MLLSTVVIPFAVKWRLDGIKAKAEAIALAERIAVVSQETAKEARMAGHEEARQQLREVNADLRKQVERQDNFINTLQADAIRCHQNAAEMRGQVYYMRAALKAAGLDPGPEPSFAERPTPDFVSRNNEQTREVIQKITEKIDEKQQRIEDKGHP